MTNATDETTTALAQNALYACGKTIKEQRERIEMLKAQLDDSEIRAQHWRALYHAEQRKGGKS